MNDNDNNDFIDLGNEADEFDPFASDDELEEDTAEDTPTPHEHKESAALQSIAPKINPSAAPANPLEAAMDKAESKEAASLYEKPPVFEYAGATENIDDTAKTFDELRIEKSDDFPELQDGKRVSWTMEYGKVTKAISDPKAVSIGKMKSDIEASKEFLDALKKSKDKNPACKVKPRVTAQSKGNAAYKGVFATLDEVEAAGKIISILPAKDGKVYEIRNTEIGRFTTPVAGCDMLSDVRAGFIPALPLISMETMMRIVAFFRYYTANGVENEVLLNVYWDKRYHDFIIDVPEQTVTKASVQSRISGEYDNDRYVLYMEIHSHNNMKACFSAVDDNDEKATRLYTVIGNLHHYFPDVRTRISNGGKFLEINPATVFELVAMPFPPEWRNNVKLGECIGGECA